MEIMKKVKILGTLALGLLMSSGMYAFGSGDDAPKMVKDAFSKKFPTVKKVKWELENKTEWEAEFKMEGTEYSANFLEDGTWQETEHEIKRKSIPSNVKTTLDTEFSEYKIEEAELTDTPEGSVYEFELEKGEEKMEVAIDTNGKVVNKELKAGDDEDKE